MTVFFVFAGTGSGFVSSPGMKAQSVGLVAVWERRARHAATIVALSYAVAALSGCERLSTLGFDTKTAFGSAGFADRCVDVMNRAFPDAEFEVTDRRVDVVGNGGTVIIAAARHAIPANGRYAREVGVECRFENNILMGFRWTAGPLRPPGVGQAP
jgi:hypothetical protein